MFLPPSQELGAFSLLVFVGHLPVRGVLHMQCPHSSFKD